MWVFFEWVPVLIDVYDWQLLHNNRRDAESMVALQRPIHFFSDFLHQQLCPKTKTTVSILSDTTGILFAPVA